MDQALPARIAEGFALAKEDAVAEGFEMVRAALLVVLVLSPLALFGPVASGQGSASKSYKPLSGKAFEDALNRLLPPHEGPGKNTRFVITLRYLPPWGAESQIRISYDVFSKGKVAVWMLPKPLRRSLDDFLSEGGKETELASVVSSIQVKKEEFEITGEAARGCLAGLWSAVTGMAKEAREFALKLDGTPEIQIVLDATTYQAFYTDAANHIEVRASGPDPERILDPDDLDAVVKWMLAIRRQFMTATAQPTQGTR